jgi:hypothetical protein
VRAESVSIVLLVVLETRTRLERAVFVLHEVFGYTHRDRWHPGTQPVGGPPARPPRTRARARPARLLYRSAGPPAVTERFLAAVMGGDLHALCCGFGQRPYRLVSLELIPDGDQVRGIYVVTKR